MANDYYIAVKQALYKTNDILAARQNLESLTKAYDKWSDAVYPNKPDPPELKVEPEVNIDIKSRIKPSFLRQIALVFIYFIFSIALWPISETLSALLLAGSIYAVPIISFVSYRKRKKKDIEVQKQSPEYQEQYRTLLAERYERQKANEEQYKRDMEEYETKTLPDWETGEPAWLEKKAYKMKFYEDGVNSAYDNLKTKIADLDNFYRTTGIVPVGYRDPDTLEALCQILGSSNYDVKSAIELLDRNRQMDMIAEQNDYLAQQTAIAEKTMREARIHYVASAIQHHNTNKQLKQINEKLNK